METNTDARNCPIWRATNGLAAAGIGAGSILLTFVLHEKHANRMPEASFLSFTPKGGVDWNLKKMGLRHKAENTAESGGAQLQAATAA